MYLGLTGRGEETDQLVARRGGELADQREQLCGLRSGRADRRGLRVQG